MSETTNGSPVDHAPERPEGTAGGQDDYLHDVNIVAVIPAYNEESNIGAFLRSMPPYVGWAVVVDDASTDRTGNIVEEVGQDDPRVLLVRHERNQGIGGAMVTGFARALVLNAQIVVKMDGDGQMHWSDLPALLRPLVRDEADYAKGNRFRDFRALARMPVLRRAGNMALSFLTKAAVGYWSIFDPCNGFVAIRGEVLAELPLEKIDRSFYFETSMLARLYLLGAVIRDVPMAARYGDELSHLSIRRVLIQFPPRLLYCLVRRVLLKNFLYDFTMESLYLLAGVPMLLAGAFHGGYWWIQYAMKGIGAPTGTVVIPAMLIILGFQLLLSAIGEDVRSVPHEPLCKTGLSGPFAASGQETEESRS